MNFEMPIDLATYQRAVKIMQAIKDAGTIERDTVSAAVRDAVPDATDDEIGQATIVYLARAL